MSAKTWLENMSQALREEEYKISLIQLQGVNIRPLVYMYSKIEDQNVTFLERLNGPPKNSVRVGNTVTFIVHDQPAYSINANRIQGVLPPALPDIFQLWSMVTNLFQVVEVVQPVALVSQCVSSQSMGSDMVIKSGQIWITICRYDVLTQDKQLLEQILVVELLVLYDVPVILNEAYKQPCTGVIAQPARDAGENWKFKWLPEGINILVKDSNRLIGSHEAV